MKKGKRYINVYSEFDEIGNAIDSHTDIHNLTESEDLAVMMGILTNFIKERELDIDTVVDCLKFGYKHLKRIKSFI